MLNRYRRWVHFASVVLLLATASSLVFAEQTKMKDFLSLDNGIEVVITEVVYKKVDAPEEPKKIEVSVESLRDLFLNRAVMVSGEVVSYDYLYEPVKVGGYIRNKGKSISFSYNLAGFGMIYENDKISAFFADPTKESPADYSGS